MKPEVVVIGEVAQQYIGMGLRRFYDLETYRKQFNLDILKDTIVVGGVFIHVVSSLAGDRIALWNMTIDMFVSGPDNCGLVGFETELVTSINDTVGINWLYPSAPDKIITSNFNSVSALSSYVKADSIIKNKPSSYYHDYQRTLYLLDNSRISLAYDGKEKVLSNISFGKAQQLSQRDSLHSLHSGDFIYFPTYFPSQAWNHYSGVDHYIFNINSGSAYSTAYWVPSLFYAAPGNLYYYPGWHYGKFGDWFESNADGNSLKNCTIVFGNYLENRDTTCTKKYGYCESVLNLEFTNAAKGEAYRDMFLVNFFIDYTPIKHIENPSTMYVDGDNKYVGCALAGFERTTNLNLYPFFSSTLSKTDKPDIHFWSFDSWKEEGAIKLDVDAFGFVAAIKNKAVCYRYKGYWTKIFESDNYHSHSVSHDGNIVALLEGQGIIESVSAYDMFKPKTKTLCEKLDISKLDGILAEIVPTTEEKKKELPFDLNSISASDNTKQDDASIWYAPLAFVNFPDRFNGPVFFEKLRCDDGITVSIEQFDDECFKSEIDVYQASSASDLVDITVEGINYNGPFSEASAYLPKVLYSSSGFDVPNEISFSKFENGLVKPLDNVSVSGMTKNTRTLNKNLIIGRTILNDVVVDPLLVLGDLSYGGCFTDDGKEDYECVADARCNGDVTYSATTSCGQSGEYIEHNPYGDRYITGPDDCVVGSEYRMNGGRAPYEWNAPFEFDDFETYIRVTDMSGICGLISMQTTDSCGEVTKINIRANGQWIYTGFNQGPAYYDNSGDFYNGCWVDVHDDTISTKKTTRWVAVDTWSNYDGEFCSIQTPSNGGHIGTVSGPDYIGQMNPYSTFSGDWEHFESGNCNQALGCDCDYGRCGIGNSFRDIGFRLYDEWGIYHWVWGCP